MRLVMRRKEHWKPKVDYRARGQVTQEFLPGRDFEALLADDTWVLEGRTVDADGPVGTGKVAGHLRLVGVPTPKG